MTTASKTTKTTAPARSAANPATTTNNVIASNQSLPSGYRAEGSHAKF